MTAAATRDDLLSVVSALTQSAEQQRVWEQEYRAKAQVSRDAARDTDNQLDYQRYRTEESLWERFASHASGTANAFEVSADMINKYVTVPGE